MPRRKHRQHEGQGDQFAIGEGKTIDVQAVRGEERLFIEVETGRSDIIANARKCVTLTGAIWFVFTDSRVGEEHAAAVHAVLPTTRLLTTADLHDLA